ncbi:hypothetical protein EIP91_005956 [Steccherinum ochraceum]|uniref:AB hydrolase-1 domain-containing protein n=1 Tax=Steccherinum ochraceum TaxID=92696 RepID=A0A4R0RVK6_9APHY|nr:hypothetical protein EIP91_005956 [Steccherinum ochraceum]
MDESLYKDLVVSRGYKYHYYARPAEESNPTIVLVHGFPHVARDWRYMVTVFEEKGYGIVAPDMLAYGGTDKPTDWNEYQGSQLSRDVIDILDKEGIQQAIALGHDWGSVIISRFCNFFPERFIAYVYLNVPYWDPLPDYDAEKFIGMWKDIVGYENFAYWLFLGGDCEAEKLLTEHIESFICAFFPKDPRVMRDAFALRGALKNALLTGFTAEAGDFMTGEGKQAWLDIFLKQGLAAPLCYYKIMAMNGRNADDSTIPADRMRPPVSSPLFYCAAEQDLVCVAKAGRMIMTGDGFKDHNVTIMDYDGDHWWPLYPGKAAEVSRAICVWIEKEVRMSFGDAIRSSGVGSM